MTREWILVIATITMVLASSAMAQDGSAPELSPQLKEHLAGLPSPAKAKAEKLKPLFARLKKADKQLGHAKVGEKVKSLEKIKVKIKGAPAGAGDVPCATVEDGEGYIALTMEDECLPAIERALDEMGVPR